MAMELMKIWPPGDWNKGHIDVHDGNADRPSTIACFCSLTWCGPAPSLPVDGFLGRVVESRSLVMVDKLSPRVRVVTCPAFPRRPLIYKFATFPSDTQRIEHEVKTYGLLSQNLHKHGGIVPTFVAHVQHNGKMIGFLLEHVSGRLPQGRGDDPACNLAHRELRELNIDYKQVCDEHFLIRYKDNGDLFDPTDEPPKAVILSLGRTVPRK